MVLHSLMDTSQKQMITMPRLFPIVLLMGLAVISSSNAAQTAKVYKWVDAQGKVSYQGSPPPEHAKVIKESTINLSRKGKDIVPVVVYTLDNCDSCEMLLLRLQQLHIPYQEYSILDKTVQANILAANDAIVAPTLLLGNNYIVKFDEPGLIQALQAAGYQPKRDQSKLRAVVPTKSATNSR